MRTCFRPAAGLGAVLVLSLGPATSPALAVPLTFPADQALVPLVVGAAFVLPAFLALAYAALCRIGRMLGPVLGLGTLALMAIVVAGYLQPGLLRIPGS